MRPVNPKHLQCFVYTQREKKKEKRLWIKVSLWSSDKRGAPLWELVALSINRSFLAFSQPCQWGVYLQFPKKRELRDVWEWYWERQKFSPLLSGTSELWTLEHLCFPCSVALRASLSTPAKSPLELSLLPGEHPSLHAIRHAQCARQDKTKPWGSQCNTTKPWVTHEISAKAWEFVLRLFFCKLVDNHSGRSVISVL